MNLLSGQIGKLKKAWESDSAGHYRLTAQIEYKKEALENVFEFIVENDDDASLGKFIKYGGGRWTCWFLKS